jgi:inorganic pyrophosphatase
MTNTTLTAINPWHALPVGKNAPETVRCVIEIPNGCKAKYELDKESGMLFLDRVIRGPMSYEANYGFVPQTLCDDGDPLDIVVLSSVDIVPMCSLNARVIGAMKMIDGGEGDDKLIAVPEGDAAYEHVRDLADLPASKIAGIKSFFENYKVLEGKHVEITGVVDAEQAQKIVEDSIKMYDAAYRA